MATKIKGTSGDDVLTGTSDSDKISGGKGNDLLIFNLAQNAGDDKYRGQSDIDTLRIELTDAEWRDSRVEYQLARYYTHLQSVKRNKHGEVGGGDFTFDFGSTTLKIKSTEH